MRGAGLTRGIWEEREKLKEGRNRSDGWEISQLVWFETWERGKTDRKMRGPARRQSETETGWRRKKTEGGKCGKRLRRMGMVMRVYRLFRCRLLIKHHQTLKLLTINALIHYLLFSPPFFPSTLTLLVSFPLGLCLPPLSYRRLFPPFCFSLSNTPNAGQINYLMHLSLSARAQSNLQLSLFTHAFSQEKKKKKVRFAARKKKIPLLFPVSFSPGRKRVLLFCTLLLSL